MSKNFDASTAYPIWLLSITAVLVILKLIGVTDKHWLIITSPTWVPLCMFAAWGIVYYLFIKPFEDE